MERGVKENCVIRHKFRNLEYSGSDALLAVSLLAAGFLFWEWVSVYRPGAGTTVFTIVICTITAVYLKKKGYKQNKRSLACMGVIALSAAVFVIFDNHLEKQLNLLFLMAAFVYWVALTTDNTAENRLSGYLMTDILQQIFTKGFVNLPILFAILSQSMKNRRGGRRTITVLIGVLVMAPVLCTVIFLLVRADPVFESLINKMGTAVSQDFLIYAGYFILGIPIACYLCSLIWGNAEKSPEMLEKARVDRALNSLHTAPNAAVCSALAALNLVYVLFFLAQAGYLFSVFSSALPENMTYAEYARRGFFELCAVAAINLAVILTAGILAKKASGKLLKADIIVLCIFTMVLTVIDIGKMVLYINSYGLTRLRVYTSIFMIFLFVVFSIVLLRQIRPFNAGRAVVLAALLCFFGLCFGNVDGQIARYNMEQYTAGEMKMMDYMSLEAMSDGAMPYLYEAYQKTGSAEDRQLLYTIITGEESVGIMQRAEKGGLRVLNLQQDKAEKIREEIKPPADLAALEGSAGQGAAR